MDGITAVGQQVFDEWNDHIPGKPKIPREALEFARKYTLQTGNNYYLIISDSNI